MSLSDSQKLKEYITRLLQESIMNEAAGSIGLAALLARALADKILDDLDEIGFLYVSTIGKDSFGKQQTIPVEGSGRNTTTIAYNIFPKQKEYTVIATAPNKASIPNRLPRSGAYYIRKLSRGMFENYGGDFIVLGNSYYVKSGFEPSFRSGYFDENISKYESIGKSFLSDYVASEENKERILEVFKSAAAVGYFAAEFIVVITQSEAAGSLGHVSADSAGGFNALVISNNAMTVTQESSPIWFLGNGLIYGKQLEYIEKTMDLPLKLGERLKVMRGGNNYILKNLVAFDKQIRRIIASNTTYIHELQHLIQHAGYQTPTSQLDPESVKKLPITSTQHPLHPYAKSSLGGSSDTARLAGLAKSKRPPAQHVKIVSDVLKEMNVIKGSEIKIKGINSPAFAVNESFYSSPDARLQGPQSRSATKEPFIQLQLDGRSSTGDLSLAQLVVKHISDTYLAGLPGSKKPEEREAQLKRFGSASGKKSVARKYRLFIADILADIGIRYYQTSKFDLTDQTKASLGLGPRDKTVPGALEDLKKNKSRAKEYSAAIKRINQSLVNKGGKLSKKLIKQVAEVFPTMVFYSRKLDVFVGRSRYGQHRFIDQIFFIEFLENYDLSKDLLSDLRKFVTDPGGSENMNKIAQDFINELDLVLVIAQSGADASFQGERERLESQVGLSGRVSQGYMYSGSQWYQRAYGYVWRRLQTEYEAEFVTGTAGFLYGIYILGTEDETTADRILAPTEIMYSFNQPDMSRFMFALFEENIEQVISYIKDFSKKSRHNFQGFIDRELRKQKSDQYRRLAIDMIDKIQNISDEELTDIKVKAIDASIGRLYNSPAKKATQMQIDGLTPTLDDFMAGKSKDKWSSPLQKNLVKGIIGYVGKKLLE